MTRNIKKQTKLIRPGVSIYKTDSSQFWYARIWVNNENKYYVRSTKESARVDAINSLEEIVKKLNESNTIGGIPKVRYFSHFCDLLNKQQKSMSGKTRSTRFAYDDEKIINRKIDGIKEYFGNREVGSIKTYDIRDYLSVLDENRKKPLSGSSKKKHTTIIAKILKVAYEKDVIDKLPIIPNVSIKDNPRPSFNDEEYSLLLKTTRNEISKGSSVRGVIISEEFYYFIVFMTNSFLRPTESEVFAVKFEDIKVKDNPKTLEIRVDGKTGFRTASTMPNAVDFYNRLIELRPDYKTEDFLFFNDYPNRTTAIKNFNRIFNHILGVAGLKTTKEGTPRTAYALRHYALQTRLIKSKGKVNIFNLAKNAGTSVEQLERFYLKNIELNEELVRNLQTF